MSSSNKYELLFKCLVPLFFRKKALSRARTLLVKLNVFWAGLFILGHLLAAFCVVRQYYPEREIPASAREVYLVFLAGFSIANQTQLWAHTRVPSRRGEYFLILWAVTTGVLWCNHFFFGRPYTEEATSIVIGVVSIYTATLMSTAFQARRRL